MRIDQLKSYIYQTKNLAKTHGDDHAAFSADLNLQIIEDVAMKWSEENKRLRDLLREAETYLEYVISGVYTPAGGKDYVQRDMTVKGARELRKEIRKHLGGDSDE